MKRHMILLPVLLAVLLIASAALYLHKPTFTFTLEKASGDMQQVEGLEYTMTVADASMRWELSGKGKDKLHDLVSEGTGRARHGI